MKKNCKAKVFCRLSVMRGALCGLLLLSLTTLFTHSPVYGQQNVKRISLKLEATSLLEALREINRLGDNVVVFKKEEVERETKRVTVDLKNVTVKAAVEACVEVQKFHNVAFLPKYLLLNIYKRYVSHTIP